MSYEPKRKEHEWYLYRGIQDWLPTSFLRGKYCVYCDKADYLKEHELKFLDFSTINPNCKGLYILEEQDFMFLKLCSEDVIGYSIDFNKFFAENGIE